MPKEKKYKYTDISMKKELADVIKGFITANPNFGYRSISQFVEDQAREKLEELHVLTGKLPRFEKINVKSKNMKILDRKLHEVVNVSVNPKPLCDYCQTTSCDHIDFAKSNPQFAEMLAQREEK